MELAIGTAAAAAATGAYLDAKLFLRKDLAALRGRSAARAALAAAAAAGRVSPYYLFEQRAAHYARADPAREAIWSRAETGGCLTWGEALDRAHRWAAWFRAQGVRPGDLVALLMLNSPDFALAWVGLWAVGAAPAMINYSLAGSGLVHCLRISDAAVVLVDGDEGVFARVDEVRADPALAGKRFVRMADVRDGVYALPAVRPGDELRQGVGPGEPAALFYTSGTTGLPKAVALPAAAFFMAGSGASPLARNPDERCYVCMPYYHGTGGITALGALLGGTTVCVAPRFSASGFWADVRDSRATWFIYVGETLRYLLAAPPSPLDRRHGVRTVMGNGCRPDVWHRFRERFGIEQMFEFFNSSEGMLALDNPSCNDFTACAVGHHGFLQRWKYRNFLVPVKVDTETGDLARDPKTGFAYRMPYEVGGEILVKVDGYERAFPGYWNNPEATDKKYARDVFRKGDTYYRTGDSLRRDGEGRWFFLDRLGDTFRWKGENVSTTQVSEVLGRYPGVVDANVYGVSVPGHDGKAGAAAIFIDPAARKGFDHGEFLRYARSHLPKYAVPVFLRHVARPSTTHNNKQNKAPLKREGVDPGKVAGEDRLFWIDGLGRGNTYVPFTQKDWDALVGGRAKL